mmetsp:Transcript_9234/g.18164  ORF Transcript_9234/g.18164 Transcript_9234/m.18164 type:complete len:137 (-) Transcript_9234:81-491(-)
MSDFWARTKTNLVNAKEASKKAAQRAKLKAEIELLRRKQTKLKHEFGVEVFAMWEDEMKREAIYASYKVKIDEVIANIQNKQNEIDELGAANPGETKEPLLSPSHDDDGGHFDSAYHDAKPAQPSTVQRGPSLDEI